MKKRILCLLLAFGMLLTVQPLSPITATAATVSTVACGTCGATESDSITWVLSSDGTLTLSGSGTVADYSATEAPWKSLADNGKIKTVIIGSGITYTSLGMTGYTVTATTEEALKSAFTRDGTVVLGNNITITSTLKISKDKNVTLDLNGYTLKYENEAEGSVIEIPTESYASFALDDTSTAKTGTVTGGHTHTGGGIFVGICTNFTMLGGTITGCRANIGGGVFVYHGAKFYMKGGKITDCTSYYNDGPGLYCNGGTCNLEGGIIAGDSSYFIITEIRAGALKNTSSTGSTLCYGYLYIDGTLTFSDNRVDFIDGDNYYAGEIVPAAGGKLVKPANPTKAGYRFDGWFTEKNGGTEVDINTVTVTAKTAYYAHWTPLPAVAPTVTALNTAVAYKNYTNKKISVTVTEQDGYSYSYQWYDSAKKPISGETESTYTLPADLTVASYDYYCIVTAKRNDNGETATTEKKITVTVTKAAQSAPTDTSGTAETVDGKSDGKITGVTTKMEYRKDGDTSYTPITGTEISGLTDGTYYIRYKADNNHNPSAETTIVINKGRKLTVTVPKAPIGYAVSVNKTELVWNESVELTFSLTNGYTKLNNFAVKVNGEPIGLDKNGKYTVANAQSNIGITVEGVADITAPEAEIRLGANKWNKFFNGITFGLFFQDTQQVTVAATDKGSGLERIYYYLSAAALSETEIKALSADKWTVYTGEFSMNPQDEYIIYAKAVDKAGNANYISSEKGIVIDSIAPVITDIANGETHYGTTYFVVTDRHIDTVKIDGNTQTLTADGKYTVTADGKEHTVVATDKSGNTSAEIKITVITIASLDDSIENITAENVNSSNKQVIEDVQLFVNGLINSGKVFVEADQTELHAIKANTEALLEKISKAAASYKTESISQVENITSENVKTEDKAALENAKKDLENALTNYENNLTDFEKTDIQNAINRIKKALEVIQKVENVITLIRKLPDVITKAEANTIKAADDAYTALSGYEQSILDANAKKKLDAAKKQLAALLQAEKELNNTSPKTGETNNMAPWFALLFVCGALLTGSVVFSKKQKHSAK